MGPIPAFEADGLLSPGDYEVLFDELRQCILVVGPGVAAMSPTWDSAWRAKLVGNLEILTRQLWQVGVTEVFADGSFAEDKDHPNDVRRVFRLRPRSAEERAVDARTEFPDPYKVWTWDPASRRPIADIRSASFRCGTSTGSSFIRMSLALASAAVSGTNTVMSWNFRQRFASPGETAGREAS